MTRLLVLGLLVLAAFWALGRFLRALGTAAGGRARPEGPAAGARRGPPARGADLVRDRVCNTYIPRDRALTAPGREGDTLYFCSERCRDTWLSAG